MDCSGSDAWLDECPTRRAPSKVCVVFFLPNAIVIDTETLDYETEWDQSTWEEAKRVTGSVSPQCGRTATVE